MNRPLRISNRHGVNPTLGVCFWCGKENGTVALMGRLPNDAEAPKHLVVSYEPCDACKTGMAHGITCIEATREPQRDDQMPMGQNAYPTGRWIVITGEAFARIVINDTLLAEATQRRVALFDRETWTAMFEEAATNASLS